MCLLCGKSTEECVYLPSVSYASLNELVSNHPTGFPGETYLVNDDVYVWLVASNTWVNIGPKPEGSL